jgi:putative sterol carrier protein
MAHFESDAEVYDQLGGILNNLVYNAERRALLLQADAVVQFAFRDPNATVTLDVRANKTPRIQMGESKLRADVVLSMDADTGKALLTGELSPTIALARGDVRTKGPVAKVLRLVPATVGASEVEADLEPEPEPEPAPPAEAPAAEGTPAETPPAEEPTGPEAAEESAPVDPPAEAEEPAAAAEEAPAEALHAEEPAPAAEEPAPAADEAPATPTPPAEEPTGPEAAEESAPVDPPVEAETPPADQAS